MRTKLIPAAAVLGLLGLAGGWLVWDRLRNGNDGPAPVALPVDVPAGAVGHNTGGTPGVALREQSPNVIDVDPTILNSPALPPPGRAGYRLFTLGSATEDGFITFTAANKTGYGLFAASSDEVVEDKDWHRSLAPGTTFAPVYPNGSAAAGTYRGSNRHLVLRDATNRTYLVKGRSNSKVPPSLRTLADGETRTVPAAEIEPGDETLWLFYEPHP